MTLAFAPAADTLAETKTAAKTALTDALAGYTEADYEADNWTALNKAKTDGDAAIDSAETAEDVTSAKDAAIAAMDAVQTKAEAEADSENPENGGSGGAELGAQHRNSASTSHFPAARCDIGLRENINTDPTNPNRPFSTHNSFAGRLI